MKNIKLGLLSLLMSGVLCVPALYAQEETPPGPGPEAGAMHHHKGAGLLKQLNLTEDQKKQLEANKEKRKEEMKTWFTQMKSQREALRQELMKKDLDMAKINGIQSQIKTLQNQMADNHLNSILEVRKILTPEQFSKFLSIMEQRPKMKGLVKRHLKEKNEDPE